MSKKVLSLVLSIVALAAFVGAAVYAVTAYLNKKKKSREDEVYDNYVECCCEPDELSQSQLDEEEKENIDQTISEEDNASSSQNEENVTEE